MTIEEKRQKIKEFCDKNHEDCPNCSLRALKKPLILCWSPKFLSNDEIEDFYQLIIDPPLMPLTPTIKDSGDSEKDPTESKMTRESILKKAIEITSTDREKQYGPPERNFETIAAMWTAYMRAKGHDIVFSPCDSAAMMILLKVSRIAGGSESMDNWIDVAGYAACGGEILSDILGGLADEN